MSQGRHESTEIGSHKRQLGQYGEDRAAQWYLDAGYEIVARNWRCREGEIDIIVATPEVLVFCEVKTRTSNAFGSPFDAVTPSKQRRIRKLAAQFLAAEHVSFHPEIRFDVAGVFGSKVEILEGAF